MKPGRELDALVAKKVMNLQGLHKIADDYWHETTTGKNRYSTEIPCYSSLITPAWEVVEKMKRDGIIELVWHEDPDMWSVSLGDTIYKPQRTLPHAICLAALEAVGRIKKAPVDLSIN